MMKRGGDSWPCWACRSPGRNELASARHTRGGIANGKEEQDCEGGEAGEVPDSPGEPLQDLRPQPGIHAQVWNVPDLLPRERVHRSPPWRHKVQLVNAHHR